MEITPLNSQATTEQISASGKTIPMAVSLEILAAGKIKAAPHTPREPLTVSKQETSSGFSLITTKTKGERPQNCSGTMDLAMQSFLHQRCSSRSSLPAGNSPARAAIQAQTNKNPYPARPMNQGFRFSPIKIVATSTSN